MRERAPIVVFAVLLIVALVALVVRQGAGGDSAAHLPALVPAREDLAKVPADDLRARARAEKDCRRAADLWWAIVAQQGDDPEAYKAIAKCGRADEIDGVVSDTAKVFEQSRLLGIVPDVLDALSVRDLVPILNRVQEDRSGDAQSLRQIGLLRRDLGDMEGAIGAFRQAVQLNPDDVESSLQLGYALVDAGRIEEARTAFRQALSREGPALRMTRLYALAVAYPVPFNLIIIALVGLGLSLAALRKAGVDAVSVASIALIVVGLGGYFAYTADRIGFWLLVAIGFGTTAWMVVWPLRDPLVGAISTIGSAVGRIAVGQIHPVLGRLPQAAQWAILVGTALFIVLIVPRVPDIDIRMAFGFLAAMLMFSTIGSLLLRLLDDSTSLSTALGWLGVAGTIPFPLFVLYFERRGLIEAVSHGAILDQELQNRLAGYGIVWLAGLGLAIVIARILAQSILVPLGRVVAAVERVRQGDFSARADVQRRDEIGALAGAIGEMADALKHREEITATFRRYVNPGIAERLLAGDASVMKGRLVHATVLFSDVRGFTSLSEKLSPAEVVDLLNEYFARMEPIVRRWGGVVDKFLGDGMLAVWDVPEPIAHGNYAGVPGERLAVEAALAMFEALAAFNEELAARGVAPLQIGVGINAGLLIAGPVGSRDRLEYTVIGDTVNTAQRVEGNARGESTLLVTDSVVRIVGEWFVVEPQKPVQLKGKRDAIVLFRIAERKIALAPPPLPDMRA